MNSSNVSSVEVCSKANVTFCDFYERDLSKLFIILLGFLCNAVSSLLMYSIIWYEHFGADSKRILTNKIVSMICWNGMVAGQFLYLSDTGFYLFGPLPKWLCYFFSFFRLVIKTNFLMFLNAIIISKYVFIFWMKNPGSLNDDFWSFFISLWTVGFSCIFNFVRTFQPQLHIILDYICQGVNPSRDEQLLGFEITSQVESLMCLFLHIIIVVRIQMFKNKNSVQSIQHATQNGCPTNHYFQNIEKVTLADFLTNFLLAVWIGNLAVLIYKISQLSLIEVNTSPYGLYLFGFMYYANSFTGLVISSVYFSRHPHLRETIWKEISEKFLM
jgi:hypothetical protein